MLTKHQVAHYLKYAYFEMPKSVGRFISVRCIIYPVLLLSIGSKISYNFLQYYQPLTLCYELLKSLNYHYNALRG